MSENKELRVVVPDACEDIEIRDGIGKTASGRMVSDIDHGNPSGKEAYGRNLETAIDFLWGKTKEDLRVDPSNRTSVEHAAAYYAMLDTAISSIVTADAACEISPEHIAQLDEIRSTIDDKHRVILASVIAQHTKPVAGGCEICSAPLFEDRCVVCASQVDGLKKEAGTPKLDFYESGFVVSLATDIANYVVTSGMNLNDAVKIAKETFNLDTREEYRLRKYLGHMGHMAPQVIWLPAAETRYA